MIFIAYLLPLLLRRDRPTTHLSDILVELLLVGILVVSADAAAHFLAPGNREDWDEAEGKELATLTSDERGVVTAGALAAHVLVALEVGGEVVGATS